jgi:uncharacterized protein YndB with AHSA1/START domain
MRKSVAVADVSTGTIVATVEITVPPERVFRALTSDELPKWWGAPGLYRTTKWTGDLRVGGSWRTDGIGRDGSAFYVEGEFLEIDRPRRLVQSWKPSWDPGSNTTFSYDLEEIEGGTRVTVHHSGFTERAQSCQDHAMGWERVLTWLTTYLERT